MPGAGLANDREPLAGRDLEINIADHHRVVVVAEGHAAKLDLTGHRRRKIDGAGSLDHVCFDIEQIEQLRERGDGRLKQVVHVRQVHDRLEEPVEIEEEHDQRSEGQAIRR